MVWVIVGGIAWALSAFFSWALVRAVTLPDLRARKRRREKLTAERMKGLHRVDDDREPDFIKEALNRFGRG